MGRGLQGGRELKGGDYVTGFYFNFYLCSGGIVWSILFRRKLEILDLLVFGLYALVSTNFFVVVGEIINIMV